jgi:hypothetical protein
MFSRMQAPQLMVLAMNEDPEDVTGRAKGGIARRDKLSPEQRSEIARNAALARHRPDKATLPKAIREGSVKLGDREIRCAVLEDGRRLLTQSDVMLSLGRARQVKGRAYFDADVDLPAFLQAKNLKPFISKDLELTSSQVQFVTLKGGVAFGFQAETLPKFCDVFMDAQLAGALNKNQIHIAAHARALNRAFATLGIVALVDEATGFQDVRPKDALQQYLELLVRKELAVWAKKFPDEFYENIYRLRGWVWPGMNKNRYSVVAHYTRDLIYERMAPGLLKELEGKSPADDKGQRESKLHQWLTPDIGDPMLASHMQSVLTLQRLALANGWGWQKFMGMVDQVMKKKGQSLDLPFDADDGALL